MLAPFRKTFKLLGAIVTVLSIVSVTQNWANIELSNLALETLGYYRELAAIAKSIIFDWWFPVKLPFWVFDLLVIWVSFFSTSLRMAIAADEHWLHTGGLLYFFLVFRFLFAPLIFFRSLFLGIGQYIERRNALKFMDPETAKIDEFVEYERRMMIGGRESVFWALSLLLGVPAFFIWSALSLTAG